MRAWELRQSRFGCPGKLPVGVYLFRAMVCFFFDARLVMFIRVVHVVIAAPINEIVFLKAATWVRGLFVFMIKELLKLVRHGFKTFPRAEVNHHSGVRVFESALKDYFQPSGRSLVGKLFIGIRKMTDGVSANI